MKALEDKERQQKAIEQELQRQRELTLECTAIQVCLGLSETGRARPGQADPQHGRPECKGLVRGDPVARPAAVNLLVTLLVRLARNNCSLYLTTKIRPPLANSSCFGLGTVGRVGA